MGFTIINSYLVFPVSSTVQHIYKTFYNKFTTVRRAVSAEKQTFITIIITIK